MDELGILTSSVSDEHLPRGDILSMIQESALANEDQCILIDAHSNDSLTYGEIFMKSHIIARHLIKLGFKKGDVMVIFCHNSIEYVLVEFAVLRMGGTCAGVLPFLGEHELQRSVEVSNGEFIFTNGHLVEKVLAVTAKQQVKCIISLDECDGCISYQSLLEDVEDLPHLPTKASFPTEEDAVSLIMFSSGTTGPTKAVMWSPTNLLRSAVLAKMSGFIVPPGLNFMPFTNTIGTLSLFCHLLYGEVLYFMKEFDPTVFFEVIQRHKIPSLTLVPSIAVLLAKQLDIPDLSFLKVVSVAGSCISADLEHQVCEHLKIPSDRLIQGLGMTETGLLTGIGTMQDLKESSVGCASRPPGSVGQVLPGTQGKVIDPDGKILGPFQEGELLFRGAQVMIGYRNNPEATADAIDFDGWIHTGDVGYYNEDGYIFVVDRIKSMIKSHGFQVSPSEIEGIIMNNDGVADCAVVGVPDKEAGEVPIAFVVLKPNVKLSAVDITELVAAKLAQLKIPREVKFVDHIPKNVTGKILRRELQEQAYML